MMYALRADKQYPNDRGAVARMAIPQEDAKVAGGTPAESAKYDDRRRQIARELLYAFSRVKPGALRA